MRVDTWLVPMVHGDRFILCSDGLVDEVHDDDIATIALAAADPQVAAEQLVAKANANGGRDNVTVVVVDVLQGVEPTAEDAGLEPEPGWPGSDSAGTMIDADANSVMSAAGIIANPGVQVPPIVVVAGTDEPHKPSHWGTRRFLKLIGAAAVLTIIITLIAVAVHNSSDNGETPAAVDGCCHRTGYDTRHIDDDQHTVYNHNNNHVDVDHDDRGHEHIGAMSSSPIAAARRRTELGLILMAATITGAAYTLASLGKNAVIPPILVPFLLAVLGLLVVAHLANRVLAKGADGTILPLAALLHGIGYVIIARLSERSAGLQTTWTFVAIVAYVATLVVIQRASDLARYQWSFLAIGAALLLMPLVPGRRQHQGRRPHLGQRRPDQLPTRRVRQDRPRPVLRRLPRRSPGTDRRRRLARRPLPPPRVAPPACRSRSRGDSPSS